MWSRESASAIAASAKPATGFLTNLATNNWEGRSGSYRILIAPAAIPVCWQMLSRIAAAVDDSISGTSSSLRSIG